MSHILLRRRYTDWVISVTISYWCTNASLQSSAQIKSFHPLNLVLSTCTNTLVSATQSGSILYFVAFVSLLLFLVDKAHAQSFRFFIFSPKMLKVISKEEYTFSHTHINWISIPYDTEEEEKKAKCEPHGKHMKMEIAHNYGIGILSAFKANTLFFFSSYIQK